MIGSSQQRHVEFSVPIYAVLDSAVQSLKIAASMVLKTDSRKRP
jgi:hypothetical protein